MRDGYAPAQEAYSVIYEVLARADLDLSEATAALGETLGYLGEALA